VLPAAVAASGVLCPCRCRRWRAASHSHFLPCVAPRAWHCRSEQARAQLWLLLFRKLWRRNASQRLPQSPVPVLCRCLRGCHAMQGAGRSPAGGARAASRTSPGPGRRARVSLAASQECHFPKSSIAKLYHRTVPELNLDSVCELNCNLVWDDARTCLPDNSECFQNSFWTSYLSICN
jgi:hypothetical protein